MTDRIKPDESEGRFVDRRELLSILGVGGAGLLAGCLGENPSDTDTSPTPSSGSPGSSSIPRGGHIKIGLGGVPKTLNPIMTVNEYTPGRMMYSNLTQVDHNLEVEPDLATDWETNEDNTVWEFTLRDDATFHHNGNAVIAEDVKATFDTIYDEDTGSPAKGLLGPIDSVEVVSDTVVKFNLTGPYGNLDKKMAHQNARIVPKAKIENDWEAIASEDFGSGPFVLDSMEANQEFVFTANEDYYGTDDDGNQLPYVDKVTETKMPEANSRITALQNDDLNLVKKVPPAQWERVKNMSGVNAQERDGGFFFPIAMRTDKEPFDDVRVRKAIKYAVDKEEFFNSAQQGLGSLGEHNPITPAFPNHAPLGHPFGKNSQPDKAKDLLEQAGYGGGIDLDFSLVYPTIGFSPIEPTATIFQEQMQDIGINFEVEAMSTDRWLSEVWLQGELYITYIGMRLTETGVLGKMITSDAPWNDTHWSNETVDDAVKTARQTVDATEKADALKTVQQTVTQRGGYIIPFFQARLTASRDYVKNYTPDPTGFRLFTESIWIEDG